MILNTSINIVLEACQNLGQKITLSGPKESLISFNDIIIYIYNASYINT